MRDLNVNQRVKFSDDDGEEHLGKVMQKHADGYFVRTETAIYLIPDSLIIPIELANLN